MRIHRNDAVAAESLTSKGIKAVVTSAVLAAAAYLAAVLWSGRSEVSSALRLIGVDTLLAMLALSCLNYTLRFARWHGYLRMLGCDIALLTDLRIYIGGFALTTTPGKAGEMARALWLKPYGVPASAALAAFIAERLQDFLAIALLSCLGVTLYAGARWPLLAGLGALLACALLLYSPSLIDPVLRALGRRGGRLRRAATRIKELTVLTRGCFTPTRLVVGLGIGLLAWGAEALALWLLLRALGYPVPLPRAIAVYALAMLAGALSFLPGGLGGSEATMIGLLKLLAIPWAIAVSATLLIRLATLWFAMLLGMMALAIRPKTAPLVATS
jgi:uncharacterized protein (TIRG00374 family)